MLRRSFSLLETGVVTSWGKGKSFGFITAEDNTNLFIHQRSIIQASGQRPIQNLRRGTKVQFDITKDAEGRATVKNVTAIGGTTLDRRSEMPSTTVDVRSLRNRLVDEDDDSRHAAALRGIVSSIKTINSMQRSTERINRNILRLFNAIAEKEGLTEVASGDAYTAAKEKVLVNVLKEAAERRAIRDAKRAKGEATDDDEDDDEVPEEKPAKN